MVPGNFYFFEESIGYSATGRNDLITVTGDKMKGEWSVISSIS